MPDAATVAVFDGHNDALTRADHADLARGRAGGHLDLPRMRAGGVRGAIFAIFAESEGEPELPPSRDDGVLAFPQAAAVDHARAAAAAAVGIERLHALERAGVLRIARTIADVDAAAADDGPPAAVLHLEGAEAIDPGLDALERLHAQGLRSLGIVWSRPNAFASGVPFLFPSSPDTGPGLTAAGRALVRACARLGVLVDLSHLNERGFWDVAGLDAGPLVASHSGAHALCAASRNLTDRQLDAIGASGGLVGIVFATPFLRGDFGDDADTPIELIVAHARYVAERIGVAHVAFGSDFDGATIPASLGDVAGMPRLLEALAAGGFSSAEIEQIAWSNWRRVLARWWARG